MLRMALRSEKPRSTSAPACMSALDRMRRTVTSATSTSLADTSACAASRTISSASAIALRMRSLTPARHASSSTQSRMPTLKPRSSWKAMTTRCRSLSTLAATAHPSSRQSTSVMPPEAVPTTPLLRRPSSSSPSRTSSSAPAASPSGSSSTSQRGPPPAGPPAAGPPAAGPPPASTAGGTRSSCSERGSSAETSCLPVQRGSPPRSRTAGSGSRAARRCLACASRWHACCRVSSSEVRVSRYSPTSVSCTMPMHGLLACGESIWSVTIISIATDARALADCGTCRFISSPSKSALYGAVTDRFMRKVRPGTTTTRWPISPCLCSEGCRLKTTTSSSCR